MNCMDFSLYEVKHNDPQIITVHGRPITQGGPMGRLHGLVRGFYVLAISEITSER